jgi:transcriptional regulator with XRE-family HTH domain
MTAKKSTAKKSTAKKSTPRTHTTPTKAISQVARMTRQMRSENGLTQKGLAKRLGFKNPGAQSQLSEWERGTFDMVFPPKQRGILARLLKVSYLDLCRKLTQDTEAFEKMGLGLLRKSTSKKTGSTKPTTKSKPYEFQGQTEATPVKDTAIKAVSVVPVKVVPAKAAVSVRAKVPEKDFVAEIVAERTRKNPEFPGLVAETSKKIRNSLFKSPRYVGQIAALISHYRKSSGLKSGEVAVSFGLPVGNPGVCTLSSWENGWCNIRLSKVQRILMIQVLGLNPGDFDRKLQEDERGRKKVLARRRVRRIELKRKGMLAVYAHAKSPQASGNQKSTDGSGRTVRNYNSARDHKPLRNDPTTIDGSVDRERSDLAKLLRTRSGERFALGDTEGAIVLRAEAQLLEGVTAS